MSDLSATETFFSRMLATTVQSLCEDETFLTTLTAALNDMHSKKGKLRASNVSQALMTAAESASNENESVMSITKVYEKLAVEEKKAEKKAAVKKSSASKKKSSSDEICEAEVKATGDRCNRKSTGPVEFEDNEVELCSIHSKVAEAGKGNLKIYSSSKKSSKKETTKSTSKGGPKAGVMKAGELASMIKRNKGHEESSDSEDEEPKKSKKSKAESESEEEPPKKAVKKPTKKSKAESESEEEAPKKAVKKPTKKVESESEEEPPKKAVKKPTKKAESESEDEPPKKAVKKPTKKVESESEDEPANTTTSSKDEVEPEHGKLDEKNFKNDDGSSDGEDFKADEADN